MGSSKSTKYLLILYTLAVLSGCRCKDNREAVPKLKAPLDCYTYWPVDSANTQWIYSVSKIDTGNKIYQYDDTMQLIGDTSITNKDDIYFREFGFKKLPKEENLIMGTLPNNPGLLYLFLNGVLYTMYDLNNISDNPPSKSYMTDGKPIDARYEMRYFSPFGKFNTSIGTVKSLSSNYKFRNVGTGGNITKTVTFIIGENKGPVYIEYLYQRKNFQFLNDSTADILYEIKKINHQ